MYVFCNKYYAHGLGISAPEIAGKTDFDFFPRGLAEKYRRDDRLVVESDNIIETEEDCILSGKRSCVRTTKAPVKDKNGNIIGVLGVFNDITEHTDREQQLAHIDKMATLGALTASVAHEINNPVHFIMLNTHVVEQFCRFAMPLLEGRYKRDGEFFIGKMPFSMIREKMPDLLNGILDGARRIQNTVAELKSFSQPGFPCQDKAVDLAKVVETALSLIEKQVLDKTAGFEIAIKPGDILMTKGNPHRLEQVFVNLIQNACFATMDKSKPITVNISLSRDKREVVIEITDHGIGMDKATLAKLYEPFFTTRQGQGGTGLGLPVALRIVHEHNGRMIFKSSPGYGTTVTVRLPACREGVRHSQKSKVEGAGN